MADAGQAASEWDTAYLTQAAVLDLAFADDGSAWAVGEAGTILRYDTEAWQMVDSPTDETLHAVALVSADEGWAVGSAGTILHYKGDVWYAISAATLRQAQRAGSEQVTAADELFDIALVNGSGWAVGRRFDTFTHRFRGLILRLDSGSWTEVAIPDTEPLYGVAVVSPNEGWAVGKAGTILRWDGIEWIAYSRTNVDLYDVAVASEEVWAVGASGFFVHWNDDQLVVESRPYNTLTRIAFDASDTGWAVGIQGTVVRYDGTTWSRVDMPLSVDLSGLSIDADGNPWVTGADGLIGRVTPQGWQYSAQPYVEADLTAIDMLDGKTGWAVGARPFQPTEGVFFWQRVGKRWNPHHERDAPPLFDVDVLSADEAWAVGQDFRVADPTLAGVVWHYASGTWATAGYPGVSALFAVEALSPGDVWVAGQDGTLVHYDGTEWERIPMDENVHLYGLHFRTPTDGWAVGERFDVVSDPPRYVAAAFRYDGETWRETPVPTGPPRLLAVYALSADDVWAVGNLGAILHYDGESWMVVQGQQGYHLLDIDLTSPTDGWAVGTHGTILRYRAGTWASVESPTPNTLNGIVSRPWGEAWAVGSQGVFLYHAPVVWSTHLPLLRR